MRRNVCNALHTGGFLCWCRHCQLSHFILYSRLSVHIAIPTEPNDCAPNSVSLYLVFTGSSYIVQLAFNFWSIFLYLPSSGLAVCCTMTSSLSIFNLFKFNKSLWTVLYIYMMYFSHFYSYSPPSSAGTLLLNKSSPLLTCFLFAWSVLIGSTSQSLVTRLNAILQWPLMHSWVHE